jgi:hypothetical protein
MNVKPNRYVEWFPLREYKFVISSLKAMSNLTTPIHFIKKCLAFKPRE